MLRRQVLKNSIKKYLNGFTLVEILIVVVIVGILAAIAIPTYYSYVRKGYATEAKTQMKNIVQASEIYKMENDSYPPDCWETLKEEDYLEIKKSITKKWEFECSFDEDGEGGTLSATSTEEMGGGAGKKLEYNKETGKYTGYGQSNSGGE